MTTARAQSAGRTRGAGAAGCEDTEQYAPTVRDQGFRRAVVSAYDHRCTLCGIGILTSNGHTAVSAAHVIPWSVSHNDDLRNGIALCGVCHWTFDEGLAGVSSDYTVVPWGQRLKGSPIL